MASAAISVTEYDTGSYGVEVAPGIPDSITTASEVVAWVTRQHARRPTSEYVPEWQQVWDAAGEVLIRGTLPHRDDDHYVENVGEG